MNFTDLPKTVMEWITLITIIVSGVLVTITLRQKTNNDRETKARSINDDLITKLGQKSEFLEREIIQLKDEARATLLEVNTLRAENNLMKEILQGRDKNALEYQAKATAAMNEVHLTLKSSEKNSQLATAIHTDVKNLYALIERHLSTLEKSTIKK
jgi:seryl-tRNA synthetase